MLYDVVDQARLLDAQQFRHLFPDAKLSFERFCGLPKSMIAIRGASLDSRPAVR
jgi:hypothetical protein